MVGDFLECFESKSLPPFAKRLWVYVGINISALPVSQSALFLHVLLVQNLKVCQKYENRASSSLSGHAHNSPHACDLLCSQEYFRAFQSSTWTYHSPDFPLFLFFCLASWAPQLVTLPHTASMLNNSCFLFYKKGLQTGLYPLSRLSQI